MNSDTLYQLLECPICYGSMKPPIRQCKIGHTFCNSCRQRITSCPICRGAISSSRAFHLEKISQTTEICAKCNKNIPLHCSVAHKDSCLNGSGDTNGERLESNSELNNHIQTTEVHNQQRRDDNSYSSSSSSSSDTSDGNISILLSGFEDSTDPDNFSDNYMIVADSSENYVSSSDDDGRNNVIIKLSYDMASSDEAEEDVSNEEYDAGNDGDESGEAESSEEEENEEEDNVEADAEDEISEDYYDDEDDDDDEDDGADDDDNDEDEEVSEEEEVSDDDGPLISSENYDTGSEENGDSSDCFYTTDEYDASD